MPGNNSVVCRPKHTAMYRNATGIVALKQELGVLKRVLVGLLRRNQQESHEAVISVALTMGTHARSGTAETKVSGERLNSLPNSNLTSQLTLGNKFNKYALNIFIRHIFFL